MRITITGRNLELTNGLRSAVEDKLGKLERYFNPDTDIFVTLSVEKERQKIEVTIPVKGNIIRSEQVSNDMYVSIDLVEEVIERQLKKYKKKIISKHQNAASFKKEFLEKSRKFPYTIINKRKPETAAWREPDALAKRKENAQWQNLILHLYWKTS